MELMRGITNRLERSNFVLINMKSNYVTNL